jgi:hypothetical protein
VKVRNFILADAVAQGGQKKTYIHGAGVTSITAPAFPHVHPKLGMLLTLVREGDEVANQVVVKLEDGQGHEIARLIETDLPAHDEPTVPPTLVLVLSDMSGLPFPAAGRYWIVLTVGDEELDRMVLDLGHGHAPGVTA